MQLSNRTKTYSQIAKALACHSDVSLSQLLHDLTPRHSGIGGNSALLTIDGNQIFVKKIPLTDLERQSKNFMSTVNLFELPIFHQYGIGLAGSFGAWRELIAHIVTTDWVLSRESPNFPLMYHWRVLPISESEPVKFEEVEDLDPALQYLRDSAVVRHRLEAIHSASAHLVLFLEYFPETLLDWFGAQLKGGGKKADRAISFVEDQLKLTNEFINGHGFCHFDAHFKNVLTDGKLIYWSDFGLALSSKFELTAAEIEFLKTHHTYDRCVGIVNLVYCLITNLFGSDQWEVRLAEYLNGELGQSGDVSPSIAATIKRYAPIAKFFMDEFYGKLKKGVISTTYPAVQLERLLAAIDKSEIGALLEHRKGE
jgi:hypothetical protein